MRLSAALCASALLALGAASPAAAIDEGVIDGGGHPNVGLMGLDFELSGSDAPIPDCTGSVVSDHVFLTAAHCIAPLPPDAEFVVTLAAGTPAWPVMQPALLEEFPYRFIAPVIRAKAGNAHPHFDPDTRAHDVAVLVFAPGTFSGVKPIALPREGLLNRVGHPTFRLVGYGADPERGNGATQIIIEGYRQTRVTRFRRLTATRLELAGGLCEGDSGSPQLLDNVAVSVLSDVGDDCDEAIGQRLDTRAERKFLARYVKLP